MATFRRRETNHRTRPAGLCCWSGRSNSARAAERSARRGAAPGIGDGHVSVHAQTLACVGRMLPRSHARFVLVSTEDAATALLLSPQSEARGLAGAHDRIGRSGSPSVEFNGYQALAPMDAAPRYGYVGFGRAAARIRAFPINGTHTSATSTVLVSLVLQASRGDVGASDVCSPSFARAAGRLVCRDLGAACALA